MEVEKFKVLLQLRPWTSGFSLLKKAIVNLYGSTTLPGDAGGSLATVQPTRERLCLPTNQQKCCHFKPFKWCTDLLFLSLFGYGKAIDPQILTKLTNNTNNETSINDKIIDQRDRQKSGQRSLKHVRDQLIFAIKCSKDGDDDWQICWRP